MVDAPRPEHSPSPTPREPSIERLPHRVQRQRSRGWRMPSNTVYVGRGSIWGNPFVVGAPSGVFPAPHGRNGKAETLIISLTLDQALTFYRDALTGFLTPEMYPHGHNWRERIRHYDPRVQLRGKNLACWCATDQRCHADILLELANK